MIVFLTVAYCVVLGVLVRLKVVPFNLWWKVSPVFVFALLNVVLIFPLAIFAPSGPALVHRHVVPIVPNVSGEIIEVRVKTNERIRKGEVMFRIEPLPYQATVDNLEAQLALAKMRAEQSAQLAGTGAGSEYELQQFETQVASLLAQLDNAKFNLEMTFIRAPADGFVSNLGLRPGVRASAVPLGPIAAFVDESEVAVYVNIHQIYLRHIEPGQEAEVVLKPFPGKVFRGEVEYVVNDIAMGQVVPGGQLAVPRQALPAPYPVRVRLIDGPPAEEFPTGATGVVAIYTGKFEVSYIIRRVMLRMRTFLNYVVPF